MDRLIPVLLPYFKDYEGEAHHPSRYGKGWDIMAFGLMDGRDREGEETFLQLVHRNPLNSHAKHETAAIVHRGDPEARIQETVGGAIERAGVAP